MTDLFGARLRQLRVEAGMSLADLSRATTYAKSYLSKIENGHRPPNRDVARLCDSALTTGGVLSALISADVAPTPDGTPVDDGAWVMALDADGGLRVSQAERRNALTDDSGRLGFLVVRGSRPAADDHTLAMMATSFDALRRLGMISSPALVIGQVIAHLNALRALAASDDGPVRAQLLVLASRVAEYAGWMFQETGDDAAARWWTRQAVVLAETGGDRHFGSYALVRQAEIAMYQQDAISTVELARRAQADGSAGPRILGLAARCEAQGHALAMNTAEFQRALDRAATLLSGDDGSHDGTPVLGSSSVADQVSLARGWSLYDLGRPGEAAETLDRQVDRLPVTARRARARFGARRALAHAEHGEVDHACQLANAVLWEAAQVDSATVRADLRQLGRTLSRWNTHGAVRELRAELVAALDTGSRS